MSSGHKDWLSYGNFCNGTILLGTNEQCVTLCITLCSKGTVVTIQPCVFLSLIWHIYTVYHEPSMYT